MPRAVFLDRDGVLNQAVVRAGVSTPPASVDELHILPGVQDACAILKGAGFLLIVVTNQPDVARGSTALETVEAINEGIRSSLPVDDIRVCYHDDNDKCSCRKPNPGLLLQAAADWKIDVAMSFMVGDRSKDVEAGKRAGCRTILIGKGPEPERETHPDHTSQSLAEAARWILQQASVVPERTNELR
jgi:D-glycero-D-manno-heptose 1,7-bisphosphate phosphatase